MLSLWVKVQMMIAGVVRVQEIALAVVREAAKGIARTVVAVTVVVPVVEIVRVACLVDNYGASPFA